MDKNIILDLHGVIFQTIDDMVMQATIKEYGRIKALGLYCGMKTGLLPDIVEKNMARLVSDCAMKAMPIPGAIDSLAKIIEMPNTTVYVCSASCFPSMAADMEKYYRELATPLAAVKHYELLRPMASKAAFANSVMRSSKYNMTYVVDNKSAHLRAAYNARQTPVWIAEGVSKTEWARNEYCARQFRNLVEFADFLERRK